MKSFHELNKNDQEILLNAPPLVMILIAGADGIIDNKEVARALDIIRENAVSEKKYLQEFYEKIAHNFPEKFHNFINNLPSNTTARNNIIISRLSLINEVFEKTDKTFNIVFYASLRKIALDVAKASGGMMGIKAISPEEAEFVDLPMIKDPSLLFN